MTAKKMKAYLYTRISTLQQQHGYGIERQISTVMDYLAQSQLPPSLGYQLDPDNYELLSSDLGQSAYKGHNFSKGELGRFKERVISGEIKEGILLIENVDRYSRLPDYEAIEHFNALISRGIDVLEVESGQVFSKKLDGTLSKLAVSIERSHQESKRKARLTTRNWEKMRREAQETRKALKNNTPMWLSVVDEQYVIDTQMVSIMKLAFERFAEGYSGSTVVRFLNDNGHQINNRKWSTINLYHMFRNRRLLGFIDKVKYYPEVIDLELFNRVQSMIDSSLNSKKQKTTKYQRSIFNGIAKCGYCGAGMVVHSTTKGILYLRCIGERSQTGCINGLIRYVELERALLKHINNIDLNAIYNEKKSESERTLLNEKLAEVNVKIEEYRLELENADDDVVLHLARVLKKISLQKEELQVKLTNISSNEILKDYFDIKEIVNQNDIELRQKANIELKKIVNKISLKRMVHLGNMIYVVSTEYHSDLLQHMMILDRESNVLSFSSLSNEWVLDTPFLNLNFMTKESTVKRSATDIDRLVINLWTEAFELAEEMITEK